MFKKNDTPVPGYRLLEKLGRGQYGVVWSAEGPGGTRVALKFIPIEDAKGEIELKAIRYVKLIRHANLVPIHAVWILDKEGNQLDGHILNEAIPATEGETLVADPLEDNVDLAFLVVCMTLADGSLEDALKDAKNEGNKGLATERVVEYMQQTARGLDFLNEARHEVGNRTVAIQHRDIKPANLLLIGDTVVIGDFGVATTMKNFHHTATTALGSLAFMAPESIARRPSLSSDQYALAITYYQLRTGELPFDSQVNLPELIDIHKKGKLDFNLISTPEQKILRKGTHKDPKQRFVSCRELVDALAGVVQSKARVAHGPSISLPLAIGGVLLTLMAIPLLFWMFSSNDNDNGGAAGTGNGNGAIVTPEKKPTSYQIAFEPRDANFQITVTSKDTDSATYDSNPLKLFGDEKVKIVAQSDNPFFGKIEREFSVEELQELQWLVRLPERTVDQVRQQAIDLDKAGKREEASKLFSSAAAIKSDIVAKRPPSEVLEQIANTKSLIAVRESRFVSVSASEAFAWQVRQGLPIELESGMVNAEMDSTLIKALPLGDNKVILFRVNAIQIWHQADDNEDCITIWQSDEELEEFHWNSDSIIVSPDQSLLAAATSFDGIVHYWKLDKDPMLANSIENDNPQRLVFSDNNQLIILSEDTNARLQIGTAAEKLEFELNLEESVTDSIFLNGHEIALTTESSTWLIHDFATAKPKLERLESDLEPLFFRASSNGKFLFVANNKHPIAQVWNVVDKKVVWHSSPDQENVRIADAQFNGLGNRVAYVEKTSGTVHIIDLKSQIPNPIILHRADSGLFGKFLRFSNDGNSILAIFQGEKAGSKSTPTLINLVPFELDLEWLFRRESVEE